MKIQIEPTDELVTLSENGHTMQARLWTGATEDGIAVQAFIVRIGFAAAQTPEGFDPGLTECRDPVVAATKAGKKIVL